MTERDLIRQTIRRLPWRQRTVLVLHYAEGLTCDEVAAVFDDGADEAEVAGLLNDATRRVLAVLEQNRQAA